MDHYLYNLLFPFIALVTAIGCLLVYVCDLRRQVKEQGLIIRQQRLQARKQWASLQMKKQQDKLGRDERLYVETCRYMDEQLPFLNPAFRIEDLAKAMKTNRTTLGDCIRKYSDGQTLLQFITHRRLNYAAQLLETPSLDMTVSQVGEVSGFKSRSAFHRQFTLYYGSSPAEFRSKFLTQTEGDIPSKLENTLEK